MYLDTHVVVWLYAGEKALLSERGERLIEENDLLISPMVLLELEFLREIGRLRASAGAVYEALHGSIGLGVCGLPFHGVIEAACRQSWTRDPFDRVIVAQATLARRPLLTRDETIRAHFPKATW